MNSANTSRSRALVEKTCSKKFHVCILFALAALAGIAVFCEPDTAYAQNYSSNKSSILDGIVVEKIGPYLYSFLLNNAMNHRSSESSDSDLQSYSITMYVDRHYFDNSHDEIKKYLKSKYGAKYIEIRNNRSVIIDDASINQFLAFVPYDVISSNVPHDIIAANAHVPDVPSRVLYQISSYIPADQISAHVPAAMISDLSNEPNFLHIGLQGMILSNPENRNSEGSTVYNVILDAAEWVAVFGSSVINTEPDSPRASANDIAVFAIVLSTPIIAVWLALFKHKMPDVKARRAGPKS